MEPLKAAIVAGETAGIGIKGIVSLKLVLLLFTLLILDQHTLSAGSRIVKISITKDFQKTKGADRDLASVSCGVLHVIVLSKFLYSKIWVLMGS